MLGLVGCMQGPADLTMPTEEQVNLAAEEFPDAGRSHPHQLLWALLQGESSVNCLAELVGASPTTVSQHLAKLRLAGLVRGRRQGTFVYYTAADEHVRALLAEALFHAEHADGTSQTRLNTATNRRRARFPRRPTRVRSVDVRLKTSRRPSASRLSSTSSATSSLQRRAPRSA